MISAVKKTQKTANLISCEPFSRILPYVKQNVMGKKRWLKVSSIKFRKMEIMRFRGKKTAVPRQT